MIEARSPADSVGETIPPGALPAMTIQASAILRLLDDEDPETAAMVMRKLEEVANLSTLLELRGPAECRAATMPRRKRVTR